MLSRISFWTDDKIWCGILSDLGAVFVPRESADVVWVQRRPPTQELPPQQVAGNSIPLHKGAGKFTSTELKAEILRLRDLRESEILKKVCGNTPLSGAQKKLVIALHTAGAAGATADELQQQLGYAHGAKTNAANTAIYQLRKIFGKEFIKNINEKYKLQCFNSHA
jgi:hypothetical protein